MSASAESVLDPSDLPLPALVSLALVAFTIEVDNEFEHVARHRTTTGPPGGKGSGGPWLVSTVMWSNCLRHVPDDGIEAAELERRAKTPTHLGGMRRWGWVTVDPPMRNGGTAGLRRDAHVELTRAGRRARDAWPVLLDRVELRWRERGAAAALDRLAACVPLVPGVLDPTLPDGLPIIGADLRVDHRPRWVTPVAVGASEDALASRPVPLGTGRPGVALYAGLSRLLLAFAREVEAGTELAMALGLNVSRVVSDHPDGVEIRAIPAHSGLAKEAVEVSLNLLARRGLASVESGGSGRRRLARPTDRGLGLQRALISEMGAVASRWATGAPGPVIADIRDALVFLAAGGERSVLWRAVEPYPDGWRAAVAPRRALPWFPMTTHRGGYPDGS